MWLLNTNNNLSWERITHSWNEDEITFAEKRCGQNELVAPEVNAKLLLFPRSSQSKFVEPYLL